MQWRFPVLTLPAIRPFMSFSLSRWFCTLLSQSSCCTFSRYPCSCRTPSRAPPLLTPSLPLSLLSCPPPSDRVLFAWIITHHFLFFGLPTFSFNLLALMPIVLCVLALAPTTHPHRLFACCSGLTVLFSLFIWSSLNSRFYCYSIHLQLVLG